MAEHVVSLRIQLRDQSIDVETQGLIETTKILLHDQIFLLKNDEIDHLMTIDD